jgi:hypothetical protein
MSHISSSLMPISPNIVPVEIVINKEDDDWTANVQLTLGTARLPI